MTNDELDKLWDKINDPKRKAPILGTTGRTDADGDDVLETGGKIWKRKKGSRVWGKVPPLRAA